MQTPTHAQRSIKNAKRDLTALLGMVKRQRQVWARQGESEYDAREAAQLWASWRLGWRRIVRRHSQIQQLDGLSRASALLADVRPRPHARMVKDANELYEMLRLLTVQGYNLGVIKGAKATPQTINIYQRLNGEVARLFHHAQRGNILVVYKHLTAAEHWSGKLQQAAPNVGGELRKLDSLLDAIRKEVAQGADRDRLFGYARQAQRIAYHMGEKVREI